MSETMLKCPACGHAFPLTEALAKQLRGEVEAALAARHEAQMRELAARLAQAEARELESKRRAMQIEQAQAAAVERAKLELEATLRAQADARVRELRQQVEAALKERDAAQAAELALRQRQEALAVRERQLDLEVARRADEKRREWEAQVRQLAAEEQQLKLREKDKTIEDLKRLLEEARRKSEQGSQELQGEVLELDIQAALESCFPHDVIKPVPKGVRGADLIQEVRDGTLRACGLIVWETKNTKHWQQAWLDKLKEDQRACQASIAVLVSVTLPEGLGEFGQIDGVWVASVRAWRALAVALREQLIQVAFAHAASEGKHEKMEMLYRYLAGDQFRARVQGIVEAFTTMQEQLNRERRAMERLWREREKQIERVVTNTVRMYGEMRGIVGASLPEIPALALEGAAGLLEGGK